MTPRPYTSYDIAAQEDRSAPRTRMLIPARLRVSGGKPFHTDIHDLSLSGFSGTAINRLFPGKLCWLTLPGLASIQSEIVWWENRIVGCAFSELLSEIVHDDLVARYAAQTALR